uniref:Uncharacterized protein n=1 Tax=Panagrolaimus superbus TaxID=310955 RepID=A0A914Z673_9BILA
MFCNAARKASGGDCDENFPFGLAGEFTDLGKQSHVNIKSSGEIMVETIAVFEEEDEKVENEKDGVKTDTRIQQEKEDEKVENEEDKENVATEGVGIRVAAQVDGHCDGPVGGEAEQRENVKDKGENVLGLCDTRIQQEEEKVEGEEDKENVAAEGDIGGEADKLAKQKRKCKRREEKIQELETKADELVAKYKNEKRRRKSAEEKEKISNER